jgi:hypothetical protein
MVLVNFENPVATGGGAKQWERSGRRCFGEALD